jgi:RNA polymerase sigma factor (sigma-70 family)
MLQILRNRKTGNPHQDEFLARYKQIFHWAQQLCINRPWEADDLTQEAFLQFMAIRPNLDEIKNLDAYLYAIVRNLHRSLLHRHLRLRHVSLSILDFDRAEDGLKLTDKERWQQVCADLELVRQFACERRETSKIGVLLILRFFHGYGVEETALLMGITRTALRARLLRARKEAREFLAEHNGRASGKIVLLPSEWIARQAKQFLTDEAVGVDALDVFLERIFQSTMGECVPRAQIKKLYEVPQPGGIDSRLLAHIVCCRTCLAFATDSAGIAGPDEAPPDDPTGLPAGVAGRTPHQSPKPPRPLEWDRQLRHRLEHYPQKLCITVNGLPLVSQPVVAGRGELTVSIPLAERIEFIEVLSEQEVRLLMLPVLAVPPDGEYEQFGQLDFGDGRVLFIRLTFDDPWPTVRVQYFDPEEEHTAESTSAVIAERPLFGHYDGREITKADAFRRLMQWAWNPASWLNARFIASCTATLVIVVLLFVQTRETTASAAVLVSRMADWQNHATQPGSVLHRSFEFVTHDKRSSQTSRQRVEVWRKAGSATKVSRLLDSSGQVLASVQLNGALPALTERNAWQFEPAADTYRVLAGDLGKVRVKTAPQRFELISSSVTLTLDRGTYVPQEETINIDGSTFEFREQSWESEPERTSPFATPTAMATQKAVAPSQPIVNSLETELAVRYTLHQAGADLGEPIEVRTGAQGSASVSVVGIVASVERRQELLAALADMPSVAVQLQTEAEAAAEELHRPVTRVVPEIVTVHSPLERELLAYFGNPSAVQNFSNLAAALSKDLMAHAWAQRHLSERYPTPGRGGGLALSPTSRQLLENMRGSHRRAMAEATVQLTTLLSPVLRSIVSGPTESAQRLPLFASAQEVQRLTLQALYGSGSPITNESNEPTKAAQDLLVALRGLEISLEE